MLPSEQISHIVGQLRSMGMDGMADSLEKTEIEVSALEELDEVWVVFSTGGGVEEVFETEKQADEYIKDAMLNDCPYCLMKNWFRFNREKE